MGKKKGNTPRRKRFKRNQRLQNAKIKWLRTTTAKNIAKSYSKWYGVDLLCAITELEILGHTFSEGYKEQVKVSLATMRDKKMKQKEERKAQNDLSYDWDDEFCFIAGYTENGVPYGIRWDEEYTFQ